MKRIVLWFVSTLSAVVLLFSYRTSLSSAPATTTSVTTEKPVGSSAATSTTPSSATPTTTAAAPATSSTTRTVTGSEVETRYGPVEVQVTVAGRKITAVQVLEYPSGGRSDRINAIAVPELVSETVGAQSARIDMVSGATYTSNGYTSSLQSALDQVGL